MTRYSPGDPHRPQRRTWLIAAGSVLVVAAAVSVVAVRSGRSGADSYPTYAGERPQPTLTTSTSGSQPTAGDNRPTNRPSPPKHWPTFLRPGDPVTAEGLKHIKPERFYWSMVKRQATQQITDLTSIRFADVNRRLHRRKHFSVVTRRIYDYPHQRVTEAYTSAQNGHLDSHRCVNGESYFYDDFLHKWQKLGDPAPCTMLNRNQSSATDGITPGGLTPHQADKFMARLLVLGTLVHPRQPRLLVDHGHRYIRMVVDFTPVKDANGIYWGAALIEQAYVRAGLPTKPFIFTPEFRAGQGMHVIYYLDPATLLPSYSKELGTPILDKQGHVELRDPSSMFFQYRFPSRMPTFTLQGSEPVVIDPPEGFGID